MNIYRSVNLEKINFDFLVHNTKSGYYDDEIRSKGGRLFYLPKYCGINHSFYKKFIKRFFNEHARNFDIVHCHISSTANIISKYAQKNGLKVILHAHNSSEGAGIASIIKYLFQKKAVKYSDLNIACSKEAGVSKFGDKEFVVVYNGIDIKKFKFSKQNRDDIRKKYRSNEKVIFGHVGRFVPVKNHKKILQLFSDYVKIHPESELWLIGEGYLKEVVRKQADDLSIGNKVKFLGLIDDVGPYLSAMDIFIFLSNNEGFGISLIEAQCSGLPSLISEGITTESILNKKIVVRLANGISTREGVLSIQKLLSKTENREKEFQCVIDIDCSIDHTLENLVSIYSKNIVNQKKLSQKN